MELFPTASNICRKCQGTELNPTDPADTQKRVMAKFGMIANKCVPDCSGRVVCPYANK